MTVLGYPVIGQTETESGQILPLVAIPMISDERWRRLARENAIHNFIQENGREPESVEAAVRWQREWIRSKEAVDCP